VERILDSTEFHVSERNREFLRYVTAETLDGRGAEIKAYSIACNVYGRPPSFDPGADPIVRIEAGKLRKSLERRGSASAGLECRSANDLAHVRIEKTLRRFGRGSLGDL